MVKLRHRFDYCKAEPGSRSGAFAVAVPDSHQVGFGDSGTVVLDCDSHTAIFRGLDDLEFRAVAAMGYGVNDEVVQCLGDKGFVRADKNFPA